MTIHATVTESRLGVSRAFEITATAGALRMVTTGGLSPRLEGQRRVETISYRGVHTWLDDKPRVTMQLPTPTNWDLLNFLATPRFSRADLEIHLAGIERALGKRVLAGASEIVSSRDCLVLTILDRPDSMNKDFQKVWIDREVGLTMRVEDYFGGEKTYSRQITSVEFSNDPPEVSMGPQQDAVIIRGPVAVETLLRVPTPRPTADFVQEIARFNELSKSTDKNWLVAPNPGRPFGYSQTAYREPVVTSQSQEQRSQQSNRRDSALLSQMGSFLSSGPPNEGTEVRVVFTRGETGGSREIQVQAEINGERREFTIRQNPGEPPQFGSPGGDSQTQPGQAQRGGTTRMFVAKSDFVDPATGNTLVLVQSIGVAPNNYLEGVLLTRSQPFDDKRFPSATLWTVEFPYPAVVLNWQKGNVRYALASTGLTEAQLADIAAKVQ